HPDRLLRHPARGLPAHRRAPPPDEHRHALRLRRGLRGGAHHAPEVPRRGAALPLSLGAGGTDPRHPLLSAADVLAADGALVGGPRLVWPPEANVWRLFAWLALGLIIYFLYGRRHSVMKHHLEPQIAKHGVSPAG